MIRRGIRLTEGAVRSTDGVGYVAEFLLSCCGVTANCVEVNCRALTRKVKGILLRKIIGVLL